MSDQQRADDSNPVPFTLEKSAWGRVWGMVNRIKRIPKTGNRVTTDGETGTFVIYGVNKSLRTAELKLMGDDLRLSCMPWDALTFLDKEDATEPRRRSRRSHRKRLRFPAE